MDKIGFDRERYRLGHTLVFFRAGALAKLEEACKACGWSKEEKENLEVALHRTQEQVEQVERGLKQAEVDGRRKAEEVRTVKNKLALLEARLAAVVEEREVAQV